MMRTSIFRELGGFDEQMRAAEDYDLWLRLLLEHHVELLRQPLVIRRAGHPGQLSATVPAIDSLQDTRITQTSPAQQSQRPAAPGCLQRPD